MNRMNGWITEDGERERVALNDYILSKFERTGTI